MADSLVQNYRTREDEEQESQKHRIRFADISLTAAWIAATYQAYSPEQIRQDIRQQWASKVSKDISKDKRFATVFEARRRGESRAEYTARRQKQNEIRSMISDLVVSHTDQLFEKGIGTTAVIRETMADLIDSDYQSLTAERAELMTVVSQKQRELAETFKTQNDKNNERLQGGSQLYRREKEHLQKLQIQEKAEYHAKVITRREFKQELAKTTDPKQQSIIIQKSQLSEKALARVLAQKSVSGMDEADFTASYKAEINKELYDKRGRRKYQFDISDLDISKKIQYYQRYFQKVPSSTLPKTLPTQPSTLPQSSSTLTQTRLPARLPSQFSQNFWSRLNFNPPKPDFAGLNSLFKTFFSGFNDWFGSLIGKAGGLLSKLPGLGGLFGGGAAAGGTAGAAGAGAAAATGAGAAAAGVTTTAAATGAAATVEIWGPILIVVVFIAILILLIVLMVFNNPVTKPQALIPTPSPVAIAPTGTPAPPYKTAGENLEAVMFLSAEQICTPLAMIKAISRREAPGTWNYSETEFDFYNSYLWWNSESLNDNQESDKAKVCGGYGYDTCSNLIPADSKFGGQYCKSGPISGICASGANVMGPMQFEQGTWNGYKNQVENILNQITSAREADRRVILDAFLAAGLKLHNNSGATDCENWTAAEIENAAKLYYGKCIYTIGSGGNYCQEVCDYYNEYSSQTVNCDLVGS